MRTARPKRKAPAPLPVEPWLQQQFPGVEGFLRAVAEEPWEDAHRLVLADWLDEQGAGERAQLIRTQVEQARWVGPWPWHWRRREQLLRESGQVDRWREGLPGCIEDDRGLFTNLHCPPYSGLTETLLETVSLADIQRLTQVYPYRDMRTEAEQLFANPALARLTTLDLRSCKFGDGPADFLARSPYLGGLVDLRLGNNTFEDAEDRMSDQGVRALTASPFLGRLQRLDLFGQRIGPAGAEALAGWPALAESTWLDLHRNPLTDAGAVALANSPHLRQVRCLDLSVTGLTSAGLASLAASPLLRSVEHLDLSCASFEDGGAAALARSAALGSLTSLSLEGANLDANDLAILGQSPHLSRLRHLNLCLVGAANAVAGLDAAAGLTGLRILRLNSCRMGPTEAGTLAGLPLLANLEELQIARNGLGDEGVRALLASPHLGGLEALDLCENGIKAAGAQAVAASPALSGLRSLDLSRNGFKDRGALALADAPHLAQLEELRLPGGLQEKTRQRLRDRWPFVRFG